MICQNQTVTKFTYDQLYDSLLQFEPHVQASKAKRAAGTHDPLALISHSNAYSSQSHASPSYSHSPQHTMSHILHQLLIMKKIIKWELQGDSQKDKLTTTMMLLARSITHKFSTPTNNHLITSSNIRNQAVIQDDRVDIQTKNAGYGGNRNRNVGRQNRNQALNAENRLTQHNDESHYARDCQKPRVRDAKYFREQMLLAMKDEAGSNLKDEENNFMLDNSYGDETLKELIVVVIMMAQI
ncbi:hypothetical protein Tco_0347856 [Tanacetum coccineum]